MSNGRLRPTFEGMNNNLMYLRAQDHMRELAQQAERARVLRGERGRQQRPRSEPSRPGVGLPSIRGVFHRAHTGNC